MSNPTDNTTVAPAVDTTEHDAKVLVAECHARMCGNLTNPAVVLEWLATKDAKTVRGALEQSQMPAYRVASKPLVESLSDDQARAVLLMITQGFFQGRQVGAMTQQR